MAVNRFKNIKKIFKRVFQRGLSANLNKHDPKPIISLFNSSKLLVSKPISNLHDEMHWEIILEKII